MIKVQFPKDNDNQYWNGKKHDIEPAVLARIDLSDYYYMGGYDLSFDVQMFTLLKEDNEKFYKVPLDDYKEFNKALAQTSLASLPVSLLGDEVELAPEMKVADLKEELGLTQKPVEK